MMLRCRFASYCCHNNLLKTTCSRFLTESTSSVMRDDTTIAHLHKTRTRREMKGIKKGIMVDGENMPLIADKIHETDNIVPFNSIPAWEKQFRIIDSSLLFSSKIDERLSFLALKLERYGRIYSDDAAAVLSLIEQNNHYEISPTNATLLLQACGSVMSGVLPTDKMKFLERTWKLLKDRDFSMDISHYNTIVSCYIDNRHSLDTKEFLEIIYENGLEPNKITYQRLIAKHCIEGDIKGAELILCQMIEEGLTLTPYILNALLYAHLSQNDIDGASLVLEKLEPAGTERSIDTYTSMLTAFVVRNDWESIETTLKMINSKGVIIPQQHYYNLLLCAVREKHQDLALKLFDIIPKTYRETARIAIQNLCAYEQYELAYKVSENVSHELDNHYPPYYWLISNMIRKHAPFNIIYDFIQRVKHKGNNYYKPRLLIQLVSQSIYYLYPELDKLLLLTLDETENIDQLEEGWKYRRPQIYYPLMSLCARNGDIDGLFYWFEKCEQAHRAIRSDYHVSPKTTADTLLFWANPYISLETLLDEMGKRGFNKTFVQSTHLLYLLSKKSTNRTMDCDQNVKLPSLSEKLTQIDQLMDSNPEIDHSFYDIFIKSMSSLFSASDNSKLKAKIVRKFSSHPDFIQKDFTGELLYEMIDRAAIRYFNSQILLNLEEFINALMNEKISAISVFNSERILALLRNVAKTKDMTNRKRIEVLHSKIGKLATSSREFEYKTDLSDEELSQIENSIRTKMTATNKIELLFEIANLFKYNKKQTRVCEIMNEIESCSEMYGERSYVPIRVCIMLVNIAYDMEMYEKTVQYYNLLKDKVKNLNPWFGTMLKKFCSAFMNLNDFATAKQMLMERQNELALESDKRYSEFPRDVAEAVAFVVQSLVKNGKIEQSVTFLEELVNWGVIQKSGRFWDDAVSYTINYHINNDQLKQAVSVIRRLNTISMFIIKPLYRYCLEKDDRELLQQVYTLSMEKSSQSTFSVLSLAVVLLEEGKIIETSRLFRKTRTTLDAYCLNVMTKNGLVESNINILNNLLELTKMVQIFPADREIIYSGLLEMQRRLDNPDGVLEIWNRLKSENTVISEELRYLFEKILGNDGREIPDLVEVWSKEEHFENQLFIENDIMPIYM